MHKVKKTLIFSGLLAPAFITPIVVTSCVTKTDWNRKMELNQTFILKNPAADYHKVGQIFDTEVTYPVVDRVSGESIDQKSTLWDFFNAFEGDVISQADGDTVTIRITKAPADPKIQDFPVGKEVRIRIPLIDTLEDSRAPGYAGGEEETRLSSIDSKYMGDLLKSHGNHVRVVVDGVEKTYDRYVGYVFFGNNFEKNWSTEMLAAGYTLARLDGGVFNFFKSDYDLKIKSKVSCFLFPFIAAAATDGVKEKRGFYEEGKYGIKTPADLAAKYKTHGGDKLLSDTYILLNPSLIPQKIFKALDNQNVYQFVWKQMDKK